jgi:death-on-curing protein
MWKIVWLLEETLTAIHHRQIAEHGGGEGLRDEGLRLSALARPQNLFAYGEPAPEASLAAAYAYGLLATIHLLMVTSVLR